MGLKRKRNIAKEFDELGQLLDEIVTRDPNFLTKKNLKSLNKIDKLMKDFGKEIKESKKK